MKLDRCLLAGTLMTGGLLLAACNSPSPPPPPPQAPASSTEPSPPSATTDTTTPAPSSAPAPDIVAEGAADYAPEPQQVVSVYEQAPEQEPAPVEVASAPPPMLDEPPPPQPAPDVYWTGGYWAWQGTWVWVSGRWLKPPRPPPNRCH